MTSELAELKRLLKETININERYYIVRGDKFPRVSLGKFLLVSDTKCIQHESGAHWGVSAFKSSLYNVNGDMYERKIFKLTEKEKVKAYLKVCYGKLKIKAEAEVKYGMRLLKMRQDYLDKLQTNLERIKE